MTKKGYSLEQSLEDIFNMKELPSEDILMAKLDKVITVLEAEDFSYRPESKSGLPGGLLDFRTGKIPVFIVPDLHARPEFLYGLMKYIYEGETVLSLLSKGKCFVVCVGDGIHSETLDFGYERWIQCYREWLEGNPAGPYMKAEMLDSIRTMLTVIELKLAFPEYFHFLKGNHENIKNVEGGGDHSFHKYVMEGEQVRDFIQEYYSEGTLYLISCFEHSLPVCALFNGFGITHAEPERVFSREDIINARFNEDLILGFTWTGNNEAWRNSVPDIYAELFPGQVWNGESVIWFGGHRPVEGKYALRQNGAFLQLHNPNKFNFAIVCEDGTFDPEKDIHSVV